MQARLSRRVLAVALGLGLVVGACGDTGDDEGASRADGTTAAPVTEGGWIDESVLDGKGTGMTGAGADALYRDASGAESAEIAPGEPPPGTEVVTEVTAGSVDDNEMWEEYLLYRQDFMTRGIPVSDIDVSGRQVLRVLDADGDPVLGATITISDESGSVVARLRSYADGRAVFHGSTEVDPGSQSRPRYSARFEKAGVVEEVALEPGAPTQEVTLDSDLPSPTQLDVLFLIDTTGSMGDEIERLKANMVSVSDQIAELPGDPDVRFGMVVYRDRGDEYVTRTFEFTSDVDAFTDGLGDVVADAGGDTPESLGAGMRDALDVPAWRRDDTVKLVFLVADAAPHLAGEAGYEDEPDYAAEVVEAAAQGVKVFPIASSGLDEQGEFVFRQLAQVTMGRFVFLTYGADGLSPGSSTPHHVEEYSVLALDELVVRLVSEELQALG